MIAQFLKCPRLNRRWVSQGELTAYVRKGRHCLTPGKMFLCLDIASVYVEEAACGQGVFTKWLAATMVAAKGAPEIEAVYIESILTDRFYDYFKRGGWEDAINAPSSVWTLAR